MTTTKTTKKSPAKKSAKKSNAGRPSKFSKKILTETRKYIQQCEDEWVHFSVAYKKRIKENKKLKAKMVEYVSDTKHGTHLKVRFPSIAGLAVFLKVNRSTVYEWKENHPEFSDMLDEMLAEQEKRLIEGGLAGIYNPMITKLVLTKHGYHDKLDQDLSSQGQPIRGAGLIIEKAYGVDTETTEGA